MENFANSHAGEMIYRRLPQLLVIASEFDADDTPPIVPMSPNYKGASEHFAPLDAIMADELNCG